MFIFNYLHINVTDLDVLTTPQLHYAVMKCNTSSLAYRAEMSAQQYLQSYNDEYSKAFNSFLKNLKQLTVNQCIVDVANGVGGLSLVELAKKIEPVAVITTNNGDGILNRNCGADFVITTKTSPSPLER